MNDHVAPLFDAIVRIDKLPASGRAVSIDADEKTRAAIAQAMKVTSVEQFKASLTVVPLRGGLRAQGKLDARITQPSIVSFEPVHQTIHEDIDRVFLPASAVEQKPTPGSEVFVDLEDDDFPDHIDGPEVDLSALMVETLALAIDAYPRLDGEDLNSVAPHASEDAGGPFAALARLKGKGEE
jgi:uncharacterized metal-binding protein YceD (DUF177 family)